MGSGTSVRNGLNPAIGLVVHLEQGLISVAREA